MVDIIKHDKCAAFEKEIVKLKGEVMKYRLFLSGLLVKGDDLERGEYTMSYAIESDIENFLNSMDETKDTI